ncbi:hypothetical protein GWI33_002069 [Rhynchophorus ferrugineus]|uniref:C-CAP/cofactor C-like domain-containing protein n=1 Tax=Rhynchophorus ferrugineus TaxID=354439 RepID=A0A834MNB6_RHYFE|nr:hypothetical protein GWI33_002069 [Rhynchophorus ferrugineus]
MELISEGVDKISILKSREIERKLNLQRKQETKRSGLAENEQLEFFERTFNEKQNFIENLIKKSLSIPKNDLPDHFNTISKEVLLLQKYVAASNLFLRNYFLQKCQNIIQELSARARDLENELMPKKKFGFKKKTKGKESEKTERDVVDGVRLSNGGISSGSNHLEKKSPTIECGFYKRTHEVLSLSGVEIYKKDVSLEKLTNCKIFTGPISTSIFAENCQNCTFVIACQQLRLHSSRNIDIYLHVTSRAIMEDCTEISIAPYNWLYENIDEHFAESGLDRLVNNWRSIDDFNWLNMEKRSPNWREMDQEYRVREWT